MTMPPQEQPKPASASAGIKKEFVCESGDCSDHATSGGQVAKLGSKYATALAGFVAGVLVGIIALYPWLALMGKSCPNPGI